MSYCVLEWATALVTSAPNAASPYSRLPISRGSLVAELNFHEIERCVVRDSRVACVICTAVFVLGDAPLHMSVKDVGPVCKTCQPDTLALAALAGDVITEDK